MKYTNLRDLTVSRIGLVCMGMSHLFTGKDQPDEVHIATIHRALELGVTFFDTAEIYGPLKNEILVGKALKGRRDDVVVATKFGMMTGEGTERKLGFDSTPANIRYAVEQSLKRLDMDYIDLYTNTASTRTCLSKTSLARSRNSSTKARLATLASPKLAKPTFARPTQSTPSRLCSRSIPCGPEMAKMELWTYLQN